MLTLRKPIVIKTARNLLRLRDGFGQRIDANYGMMSVKLTPADMIHFMMAPPHVYIQERGMTLLARHSGHTYSQNVKMQFINNMLNRILVSDTIPMTYQDSVFVTHIMHKIGVTDVEEFVRQFWQMQHDLQNVRQLTALYQSKHQGLKAFLEHQKEHQKKTFVYGKEQTWESGREYQKETLVYEKGQNGESGKTQNHEYWLHQSIIDRLHSKEIYSEIRDFTIAAYHSENRIAPNEIRISEQIVNARKIFLDELRNETLINSHTLVHNRQNSYASVQGAVKASYEQIVGDLAGAVLLNVLTQIYAVCLERQEQTGNNWYAITDFLNQTAKNTISRFEYYDNGFQLRKSEKTQYYNTLWHNQKIGIHMLQKIFAEESTASIHVENQQIENTDARESRYNTVSQYAANDKAQNRETAIPPADTVNYHAVNNISADNSTVNYDEEQMIRQQLETIHNSNLKRVEQIQQLSFQNAVSRFQRIDMEKAREDILHTAENPNKVLIESLHSENYGSVDTILQNQELMQILGEETVRAFAEVKKLHEHSTSPAVIEEGSIKAFDQLVHDVSAVRLFEQIKKSNTKHAKSILQTDLTTGHHQKNDTSVINLETSAVIQNDIRERYESMYARTKNTDRSVENKLELFHRQTGRRISEETLNELIKSSRQVSFGSAETTANVREINSVTENTNNSFHVIGMQQKNDMERMISQNINRQLRELSEQVYTRLERRMDSERRRRGL